MLGSDFWADERHGDPALQWSKARIEDPKRTDLLVVQCFCVCRGGVLLGGLLGVSGYMEREILSVLALLF